MLLANSATTLTWDSEVGESYYVLGSEDLEFWFDLNAEILPGTGGPIEFKHMPVGNPSRYFYSVEKQ